MTFTSLFSFGSHGNREHRLIFDGEVPTPDPGAKSRVEKLAKEGGEKGRLDTPATTAFARKEAAERRVGTGRALTPFRGLAARDIRDETVSPTVRTPEEEAALKAHVEELEKTFEANGASDDQIQAMNKLFGKTFSNMKIETREKVVAAVQLLLPLFPNAFGRRTSAAGRTDVLPATPELRLSRALSLDAAARKSFETAEKSMLRPPIGPALPMAVNRSHVETAQKQVRDAVRAYEDLPSTEQTDATRKSLAELQKLGKQVEEFSKLPTIPGTEATDVARAKRIVEAIQAHVKSGRIAPGDNRPTNLDLGDGILFTLNAAEGVKINGNRVTITTAGPLGVPLPITPDAVVRTGDALSLRVNTPRGVRNLPLSTAELGNIVTTLSRRGASMTRTLDEGGTRRTITLASV